MKRLLIRPGAIGDTILSLPAMASLRGDYTEIWCRVEMLPLLGHAADQVESIAATGIDAARWPPQLHERLASFDEIVTWYGSNREEFRAALSAIHPRVRYLAALPPDDSRQHAVDFFLEQVGASPGATPKLPVRRSPGQYAVIHPFSGSAKKNWSLERFAQVARELECEMPVFWSAGPEEKLATATRFERLDDLAEWIAGAEVYIGNDSGITHLAAAVGTPVVALFGPTNPAVWGPRGERVRTIARASMEEITAHEVLEAITDLLSSGGGELARAGAATAAQG